MEEFEQLEEFEQREIEFKKSSKKGFTLVELIVVIVIIAILAAITVPALVGYIDKAKVNQTVAECQPVVEALNAISVMAYEGAKYSSGGQWDGTNVAIYGTIEMNKTIRGYPGYVKNSTATGTKYLDEVNNLTGGNYTLDQFFLEPSTYRPRFDESAKKTGKLIRLYFRGKNGVVVKYESTSGYTREPSLEK